MTQQSAPMPERDVSPATEAGRALLDAMFTDEGGMPVDPGAAVLAIEQEAAAIERRKTARLFEAVRQVIREGMDHPGVRNELYLAFYEVRDSPPSSDRGA